LDGALDGAGGDIEDALPSSLSNCRDWCSLLSSDLLLIIFSSSFVSDLLSLVEEEAALATFFILVFSSDGPIVQL
jgi:hypothetical protein